MTKKDYKLIADSFRESMLDVRDFGLLAPEADIAEIQAHVAQNLALALSTTNPRFDQDKFLAACGVKEAK